MTEHFTQAGMRELAGDIGISFYPRHFSDKNLTDLCNAAVNHKLQEWGAQKPVATISDLRNSLMFSLEVGGYLRKDKLYAAPVAPAQPVNAELVIAAEAMHANLTEGEFVSITRIEALGKALANAKAAPVQVVPDGWQPIETAPKDGTRILLFSYTATYGGSPNKKQPIIRCGSAETYETTRDVSIEGTDCFKKEPYTFFSWKWDETFLTDDRVMQPTHWMPLPAAPQQEQKGGE